jgi:Head domain of trimeric autotransporter adhesin
VRAHYRAPIQDNGGALIPGAVISVYVNGTTTPPSAGGTLLSQTLYSDGSSGATLSNPFTTPDGNVSFYLAAPQRVDLGVLPPGGQLVIYPDIDVEEAAVSSIVLTFPGSSASSTALGNNSTATEPQAVALGDTSAASGQQSMAAGQQANASAPYATALGQLALASGNGSTAVGQDAQAPGAEGTAIGYDATAGGQNATALGAGASASGAGSTAVGAGASVSAVNQVMLGTSTQQVIVPGDLQSVGLGSWQPSDNGLVAASYDLNAAQQTQIMTAGTLYLIALSPQFATTFAALWWAMSATGTGTSSGSFSGLYSSSGALLTGSADIGANFVATSPTPVKCLLSQSQPITGNGFYWGALLVNLSGIQPTLYSGPNLAIGNLGCTPVNYQYCINGTGLTTLPSQLTIASNALTGGHTYWSGASSS